MPSNLTREQREQIQRLAAKAGADLDGLKPGEGLYYSVAINVFRAAMTPHVAQAYEAALVAAETRAERAETDGPDGAWICQTCGFVAMKMLLRASDMAVGIDRREVQDICPNDGTSLRRKTWREDALDSDRVGRQQMERAEQAETHAARLREALTAVAKGWHADAAWSEARAEAMPGQRTNHQLYEHARTYRQFASELEAAMADALAESPAPTAGEGE